MSLATDQMSVSRLPNRWKMRSIVAAAVVLASFKLVFSFGIFAYGHYVLHFDTPHLQTLTFATIVLSTQYGIYLPRERAHFWASRPSPQLVASSIVGIIIAIVLSQSAWLMPMIDPRLLAGVGGLAVVYFVLLDWCKVALFNRLKLR